jgi:deoxycytidylate deaminase
MNYYFNLARLMAEKSEFNHKIGCVIVKDNKIISLGFNQKRTHPMQFLFSEKVRIKNINNNKTQKEILWDNRIFRYIHAEIDAISSIIRMRNIHSETDRKKVENASIYIYRQNKNGTPALARPCAVCLYAIKFFKFRRMYYTTNDGFAREDFF